MDLRARMAELARITAAPTSVVSVYLDTRWTDEQQRDRVRIFLKNELAQARRPGHARGAAGDLDWIEAQGEQLLAQAGSADTGGVALFACEALGLREVISTRLPFENAFVVADAPLLRPLASLVEMTPSTLVIFVDAESARLVRLTPGAAAEETTLEADVPGHPTPGGGTSTMEARYRRHLLGQRARHYEAVAEALVGLVEGHAVKSIVVAGEPRNVAALRAALPPRVADRIVGTVAGARRDPTEVIVARAVQQVAHVQGQRIATEVDALLTLAAKGGQAAVGLEATLRAVNRGAVHRLYILSGFQEPGTSCQGCRALQAGFSWKCSDCGDRGTTVELGEAMAERVAAAGGTVDTVEIHQPLAAAGGVAAELRYPL